MTASWKIPINANLANAAARDAGNRSMRRAGRKTWSREDYNEAVRVYNNLWPKEDEKTALLKEWEVK